MKQQPLSAEAPSAIAESFVSARKTMQALANYPGAKPTSLDAAYAIQDQAIDLWSTSLVGWKVGRIVGETAKQFGVDRLAGPIFAEFLWPQALAPKTIGIFDSGFAAVEGEVVAIIGSDAPSDKYEWDTNETKNMIESMHAGTEIASSPYADINNEGPLVVISDFGNNLGLIIGAELDGWRNFEPEQWQCRTLIDGTNLGEKTAAEIPGGPVESVRFMLENAARRGRPLKKGAAICTGAITGVHEIKAGQSASIEFVNAPAIKFDVVDIALQPASATMQA